MQNTMKITPANIIFLHVLTLTAFCSMTLEDKDHVAINRKPSVSNTKTSNARVQRQNKNQKPAKPPPPPGLFTALTSLLGGTVADTFTAYRNVSRLVQTAFAPPKQTLGNATAPTNGTSFTLRQALGLLERNYRGLRRLFDSEFTRALNDSMKNALDFRKELKNSARMYLEYDNANTA